MMVDISRQGGNSGEEAELLQNYGMNAIEERRAQGRLHAGRYARQSRDMAGVLPFPAQYGKMGSFTPPSQ